MSGNLSEIELSQISRIVYLDVIGDDSELSKDYGVDKTINLGEVIDYYLGKGNYTGNNEGVEKIKERYAEKLNDKFEYDEWFDLLKSLDQESIEVGR